MSFDGMCLFYGIYTYFTYILDNFFELKWPQIWDFLSFFAEFWVALIEYFLAVFDSN